MTAEHKLHRILLLDSNRGTASQLMRRLELLSPNPFSLEPAASLAEALELLEVEPYAAVMMRPEWLEQWPLDDLPRISLEPWPTLGQHSSVADDFIWDQAGGHELQRCLRYAIERHALTRALQHAANIDALTGCCNRTLFRYRLEQGMERGLRNNQPLAVMWLDLDDFKHVNDSLGHRAGDRIICDVVRRLRSMLRTTDTIARMGSDEFALLVEDYRDAANLLQIANKLIRGLAEPYHVDGESLLLGCSMGVATYPEAGSSVDGLLLNATLAMREAKRQRGCQFHFYNEHINLQATRLLQLEADLRRAIRRSELELHYQPRIDMRSGEIVGVESLVRWRHPDRGLLGPGEFIPLAEQSGLIVPMGYWVIARACHDMARMRRQALPQIQFAVNLSFRQFQDSQLLATVTRLIERTGIDARWLEFELTETAIMQNPEQVQQTMQGMNSLGVRFSLDDFGTGFSSFVHLQSLPIDLLKLDRSFIQSIEQNQADRQLVSAMIDMGHHLGLEVVAEGVELRTQMELLQKMDCDQVQGYYISPALGYDELCHFIDAYNTAREHVPA